MTPRRLPRRKGGAIAIPFAKAANKNETAQLLGQGADMFELRLDLAGIETPEEAERMAASFGAGPLICTCRSSEEGGTDKEDYERLMMLAATVGHAHAIDMELSSATILPQAALLAENNGCELVVSHHDLSATPGMARLDEIADWAIDAGADIIKIATTCHSDEDIGRLADFLERRVALGQDLAVMGMGDNEFAKQSRVKMAGLGSVYVFASAGFESAPGQPGLEWLAGQLGRDNK